MVRLTMTGKTVLKNARWPSAARHPSIVAALAAGLGVALVPAAGGAQTFMQELRPPAGSLQISMGYALAVDGDTLIAGDPDNRSSDPANFCPSGRGAVTVFKRSGTSWLRTQYLPRAPVNQEARLAPRAPPARLVPPARSWWSSTTSPWPWRRARTSAP